MWFPEIFSRVEKYGGSPCDHSHNNLTANETTACQPIPSNWVFFEGFMTAVSNLPGNLLTIFVMDKIGRKPLLGITNCYLSLWRTSCLHYKCVWLELWFVAIVFNCDTVISWWSVNLTLCLYVHWIIAVKYILVSS